jgi:hypothetical protein
MKLPTLRTITISDRTLSYRCFYKVSKKGENHWTQFYNEHGTAIFTIDENCDCPSKNRGWWRKKITEELEKISLKNETY